MHQTQRKAGRRVRRTAPARGPPAASTPACFVLSARAVVNSSDLQKTAILFAFFRPCLLAQSFIFQSPYSSDVSICPALISRQHLTSFINIELHQCSSSTRLLPSSYFNFTCLLWKPRKCYKTFGV